MNAGAPADALVGHAHHVDSARVRYRLDAHLGAVHQLLQQDGGLPPLPAGVDRKAPQNPYGSGELLFVVHPPHVHARAQVDRLDDQRVADLPCRAHDVGPLLVHGEARPGDPRVGEDTAGGVLAAGALDRFRGRARQTQMPGDPRRGRQVVVAGGDHAVEAQHLVQPLDLRQQNVGVVGVGGDHVAGAEQRVCHPLGRGAEVVVQVAGEERELVPALPDRPWQQSAHRPDPAFDHQQMSHNSPLRASSSNVRAARRTLRRKGVGLHARTR